MQKTNGKLLLLTIQSKLLIVKDFKVMDGKVKIAEMTID